MVVRYQLRPAGGGPGGDGGPVGSRGDSRLVSEEAAMTDYSWLQWAVPAGIFALGLSVHFGINETRLRGQQHQINTLKADIDGHMTVAPQVLAALARLDERTEIMDRRMERIENRMNEG